MAYFSRQNAEPVVKVDTVIWSCENDNCVCWMRKNYTFEATPQCPICQTNMREETRLLPSLD
ncbi:MAG: hypothetical protein RLZZ267_104 [Bacillota bacterium]|jgi:hypothetical protein